jgi:TP901 family phage tail tape measure protein
MAARPKLTLDALDELLKKAEVTYKKLQDVEGRLEIISKKGFSLDISPETVRSLKALTQLSETFKTLENVKQASVDAFANNLKTLVGAVEDAKKLVSEQPDGSVLRRVSLGVKDLIDILVTVSDDKAGSRFSKEGINKAQESLKELFSLLHSAAELKDVSDIRPFIKSIESLFTSLSSVATSNLNVDNIRPAIKAITSILKPLRELSKGLTQSTELGNNFKSLVDGLTGLLNSIPKLEDVAQNVGRADISRSIRVVTRIVKSVSKLAETKLPPGGAKAVQTIGELLRAVSSALDSIRRAVSDQDVINASGFFSRLTIMRVINKAITQTVKPLKGTNPEELKGIAATINAVASMLKETDDLLSTVGAQRAANPRALKKNLSAVSDIFTLVGKLHVKDAGNIASLVQALGPLLATVTEIAGTQVDSSKVKSLFRDMVEGLNEFGKLQINRGSVDFLKSLSGQFMQIGAALAPASLIGQIKFGIFTRIGERITDAIIAGLSALRPDRLFEGLITGTVNLGKGLYNAWTSIRDRLESVFRDIREAGQNLASMGQNLISGVGIGVLLGSAAFGAASEFDALSTQIKVFGRLTEDQLASAQDFANEIGIKYPLSANEAASAMLGLMKAGQDLSSIKDILPNAADLAALMDSKDIEGATQMIIAATSSFKMFSADAKAGFDNANVAANLFANAADASQATVEGLGESLANVGPIASQYNLSLADTLAIMGEFSNASLVGAEAGTALKSMLSNLSTTTAKNELSDLGVSLVDANGNFRDFDAILKDINKAMSDTKVVEYTKSLGLDDATEAQIKVVEKALANATKQQYLWQTGIASGSDDQEKANEKLTEYQRQIDAATSELARLTGSQTAAETITATITRTQQQNAESLKNLFGSYGQVAGSILLASGGFDAMRTTILGSGTAAERAAALMDNLAGDVEQLKGSVETLMTKAFLPLIAKVFRPFVQVGRLVIDSILRMDGRALEFVSTMIAFVSIAATVVGGLAVIAGTVISVGAAFAGVILAMTNVFAIVGALVGGLAALATGFVVITGAAVVIGGVLAAVTAVFETFHRVMSENLGGAKDAWDALSKSIGEGAQSILQFLQSVGNLIGAVFGDSSDKGLIAIGERLAAFFNSIANNARIASAKKTLDDFSEIFNVFTGALTLNQRMKSSFSETLDTLDEIPMGLIQRGGDIRDAANEASEATRKAFNELAAGLADNPILQKIFGKEFLSQADVQKYISTFLLYAAQFRTGVSAFLASFGTFFDDIGKVGFGKALSNLSANLDTGIRNIGLTVLNAIQELFGVDLSKSIEILKTNNLSDSIIKLLQNALLQVKDSILHNRGTVASVLKAALNLLFMPLKSVKFISEVLGLDALGNIVDSVQQAISTIFGGLVETILNLMEGQDLFTALRNGFGEGIEPLLNFARALLSLGDTIGMALSRIFGGITDSLTDGADVGDLLNNLLNGLTTFVTSFNKDFLTPLVTGDVWAALSGFGKLIGSDLIQGIADDLKKGDFGKLTGRISSALWGVIRGAIKLVPRLITDLGRILNVPILSRIGESLESGQWLDVIGTIASSILRLFTTALASIPALITNLGSLINSPILGKIGEDLATGNWGGVISTIASSVATLFTTALRSIPNLVSGFGEFLNSPLLTKIAESLSSGDWGAAISSIASGFVSIVTDAIKAIPGLITNLGVLLNSPLLTKIGDDLKNGDWASAITTITTAIKDLVVSAIQAVPGLITNLGELLSSPLLVDIGTAFETQDWTGLQTIIGNAISGAIRTGMSTIGNLLVGMGDLLKAPLLAELGNAFITGDFSGFVTTVSNKIVDLLKSALQSVPTLLIDLGTTFASPFLTNLGTSIQNADPAAVIQTVAQAIADIITAALGAVPGLLATIGDLLNIDFLTGFGLTLQNSIAFQMFTSAVGQLVTYPLDIVAAGLGAIKSVLAWFTDHPDLAPIVAGAAGALGLLTLIESGKLAAIAYQLGVFVGNLGQLIAFGVKIIGIGAAIIVLKNALENLGTILSGDIWGGIGDTLIGIVEDITNLTGLDVLLKEKFGIELDFEAFRTTWYQLGVVIESILNDAAERASTAVRNILDGLALEAIRTGARIAVAGGLATEGFGKQLFQLDEALAKMRDSLSGGNFGFTTMSQEAFSTIAAVLADPANRAFVLLQLRTAYAQIFDTFQKTDFRTLVKGDAAQQKAASDILAALIGADGLVEGAAFIGTQYGPDVMKELFTHLLEYNPNALQGIDPQATLTELFRKTMAGQVGSGVALDIAMQLKLSGVITQEQYDQFVADMKAKIAGFQETGGGRPTDVPLPVTVTPQPKVSPFTPGAIDAAVQGAMPPTQQAIPTDVPMDVQPDVQPIDPVTLQTGVTNAVNAGLGSTVVTSTATPVEVPVTTTFEVPTNREGVDNLTGSLEKAATAVQTLRNEMNSFTGKSAMNVLKLNAVTASVTLLGVASTITFNTFLTKVTAIGTAVSNLADLIVNPKLNSIILKLTALLFTTQMVMNGIVAAINTEEDPWALWAGRVTGAMDDVLKKTDILSKSVQDLLIKIATLLAQLPKVPTDLPGTGGSGGGGSAVPEGMAEGGRVGAGVYRILEDNIPEMLTQGGRSWLLSPGTGEITALKNVPSLGLNQYRSVSGDQTEIPTKVGSGQTSNTYVNINEGDIVINIPVSAGMSPQEIVATVRPIIREELDARNQNLRHHLRSGHR